MPKKLRIRRSSALMANDPYTLVVALDAEVCLGWEWGFYRVSFPYPLQFFHSQFFFFAFCRFRAKQKESCTSMMATRSTTRKAPSY